VSIVPDSEVIVKASANEGHGVRAVPLVANPRELWLYAVHVEHDGSFDYAIQDVLDLMTRIGVELVDIRHSANRDDNGMPDWALMFIGRRTA
jgi:hypothetical protein